MLEMENGSTKPPQISEMFSKFALAFKSKTFEFFADEENSITTAAEDEEPDVFTLLDSAEDFIPDQKVVVIKPDPTQSPPTLSPHFTEKVISSLFGAVSLFEASYLQLQTAHVPFDEQAIKLADQALVSHLQRLSDVGQFYRNFRRNPDCKIDVSIGSTLEAQVEENQSKLRALETMVNRLQSDIDAKDDEFILLRRELDDVQQSNLKLSKRLSKKPNSGPEVLLTIRVFESLLRDTCRSLHRFAKLFIELMKRAGWDLDLAADSVHSGVDYAKKGHNRYAFLSYVCFGMFRGFDSEGFGLTGGENVVFNGDGLGKGKSNGSLKQLIEHVANNPIEVLSRNPRCDFSRFCVAKYEQLIHPTMESSIFSNLDRKEVVLDSWKSLSVFYELFVKISSSVWLLHKLAYSFSPVVEIFQVERGVDYSTVYMEDVTKRGVLPGKSRPKVGFTVVPGFRVGRTIIQSQNMLISPMRRAIDPRNFIDTKNILHA